MANTFITLAVPVVSGVGAASDVSGVGPKTVLIEGVPPGIGPFAGSLVIEGSQDGGSSFVPLASIQIPVDPPKIVVPEVIGLIRVRRDNVSQGTPAPVVTVGAETIAGNVFASFAVPAGDGTGFPLDTSANPTNHTILVSGVYRGLVIVEASMEAAGENFDPVAEITSQGVDRASFSGAYARMRVRRENSGLEPGLPIVTLGSGSLVASGGGGGGENVSEILRNDTGLTVTKGTVVRLGGGDGRFVIAGPADPQAANILQNLEGVKGVAAEDIGPGATGKIINLGKAEVTLEPGLSPNSGDTLWLSPNVNEVGRATNIRPTFALCIGTVKDTGSYNPMGPSNVVADFDPDCELPTGPDEQGYRSSPTPIGSFDRTYLAGRFLSSSPSSSLFVFDATNFDRAWLIPVVFPVAGTIRTLRQFIRILVLGGGALIDVSLYSNKRRNTYPDKQLSFTSFVFGGAGPVSVAVDKIIAPGLYWLAIRNAGVVGGNSATIDAVAVNDMFPMMGTPVPIGATPLPWGVALTRAGAFADPFPAGATIVENDNVGTVPSLYYDFETA